MDDQEKGRTPLGAGGARGEDGRPCSGPHPPTASLRAPPSPVNGRGVEPPPSRQARSPSPRKLGEELSDYQAERNRRVQVTRRGWNRFDQAKKKVFLKWFAATANARESARRAGVGYSTVFDHRMDDARFSEAWDRALDQGYARLEATNLQMQFEQAAGPPLEFDGAFEPPESRLVDPVMAMQLLKQHKAEVARIRAERAQRDDPPRRGRVKRVPIHERERLASDAEVQRALVRSLKAFGVRVTKEDLAGGAGPLHRPPDGPPPPAEPGADETE